MLLAVSTGGHGNVSSIFNQLLPPSRTLPPSHHYDNDFTAASAAPIYSTVKPKVKLLTLPPSASPIYDMAAPTNQREDLHLVPGQSLRRPSICRGGVEGVTM